MHHNLVAASIGDTQSQKHPWHHGLEINFQSSYQNFVAPVKPHTHHGVTYLGKQKNIYLEKK